MVCRADWLRRIAVASLVMTLVPLKAAQAASMGFRINPPSISELNGAKDVLKPAEQAIVGTAVKSAMPVFIFIPGILGSALSRTVAGRDVMFWGKFSASDFVQDNPAFKYTDGEAVSTKVLDTLYAPLKNIDIYGKAYAELSMIMGPANVLRFSYDWRQSNIRSASDFSRWLCRDDVRTIVKGRPVVFLAHSMGGLVLKYWLEHSYAGEHCPADTDTFEAWMPIQKLVFAGTPNYGAPKAVLSFSRGETLYVDPANDGPLWRALVALDMNTISRNLNKYGIRYPSAYQLLPVVNTTACFSRPGWETDLEFRTANDVQANIDLFEPRSWSLLGWPAQLSSQEREQFNAIELPALLSEARTFLCDVAAYDVDRAFEGKVVHFSGLDQKTVCKILFKAPDYQGDYVPGMCPGDGTVPNWIAADVFHLKAGQPSDRQPHAALMSAVEFSAFLAQLHNEIYSNLTLKATELEGGTQTITKLFTQLHYLPHADPTMPALQTAAIAKVADQVVADLALSPGKDILRFAEDKSVLPTDRSNAFLIYSNLSSVTSAQRAQAIKSAAEIKLDTQDWYQSFELSKSALGWADAVPASNPASEKMRHVKSQAAFTAAIASARLGNRSTAMQFRRLAIESGNKKAINVELPFPTGPSAFELH
ncbi:hypothetical protein ACVWZM_001844 [Bradyrhizobium sp. USDA 4501]